MLRMLVAATLLGLTSAALDAFDCTFKSSYPEQYVVYKTDTPPKVDGKIDDPAWADVPWTQLFVDISTDVVPRFETKAKLRYDNHFLYVAAHIEEPHVWANITETCHCLNNTQDQVIFHDNDFEIFTNPDGSTHFYKEFEMNARNQTWDLLLQRPYDDGGGENSTRVDGKDGFDMQPPLFCGTAVEGTINDPRTIDKGWSVEVALPLKKLAFNQLMNVNVPPKDGDFWRMDFSRVEYTVKIVGDHYEKVPHVPEDNWVWSKIGVIDMHNPDRWGMLQFSTARPGTAEVVKNPEWPLREQAMAAYYAEHGYKTKHGRYTADLGKLVPFLPTWIPGMGHAAVLDGTCGKGKLTVSNNGSEFEASFEALTGGMTAHVDALRLLAVTHD